MDIFNLLDSDRDGEISAEKIDISKLESHVLEAFSPLLCEMEELGQSLNFEEFYEASDRLLQVTFVHPLLAHYHNQHSHPPPAQFLLQTTPPPLQIQLNSL